MTIECRSCGGKITAESSTTPDGKYTARVLVCQGCKFVISQPSWWNNEREREERDYGDES